MKAPGKTILDSNGQRWCTESRHRKDGVNWMATSQKFTCSLGPPELLRNLFTETRTNPSVAFIANIRKSSWRLTSAHSHYQISGTPRLQSPNPWTEAHPHRNPHHHKLLQMSPTAPGTEMICRSANFNMSNRDETFGWGSKHKNATPMKMMANGCSSNHMVIIDIWNKK